MSIALYQQPQWHPRKERRMSEAKSQATMEAVRSFIGKKNTDIPFYIADFSDIVFKARYWKSKLPRVEPFYAVKCNSDPMLLSLLVSLGFHFDCASKGEIESVMRAGAGASDVIYAHPFKSHSFLRYAASVGVDLMTFDSENELIKIKRTFPSARLVIRIRIPNVVAAFPLSDKFGCAMADVKKLLHLAHSLDMSVVGVSFHVGSLCEQPAAYARAIGMAREVFDVAEEEVGYRFSLLDIGGGFPGASGTLPTFDKMSFHINQALDEYFPEGCGVHVIAEPGCFIPNSAYTLITKIIGKKIEDGGEEDFYKKKCFYYLNDGTYGSFGYGFEKYGFNMKPVLSAREMSTRPMVRSKVWGGTCCSSDCVLEDILMPQMEVGEHLLFTNMGAYTQCLATRFNGFPAPRTYYVFPPQQTNDQLAPFEDFCREMGATRLKAFVKIQDFICHDDSNDDLFRKG